MPMKIFTYLLKGSSLAHQQWKCRTVDVKLAYLQGDAIERETYTLPCHVTSTMAAYGNWKRQYMGCVTLLEHGI